MDFDIRVINGETVEQFLERLGADITLEGPKLFRSLADYLVNDIQTRIRTSDGGRWKKASKWLRAKSGQSKVLLGAERWVRARITESSLKILDKGGKWTLDQHHHGFQSALIDNNDKIDEHGRVVLKIKDPRPLALYGEMRRKRNGSTEYRSNVFAFVPKRRGQTPARKIWPTKAAAERDFKPIISRWLLQVVKDAGGEAI